MSKLSSVLSLNSHSRVIEFSVLSIQVASVYVASECDVTLELYCMYVAHALVLVLCTVYSLMFPAVTYIEWVCQLIIAIYPARCMLLPSIFNGLLN